MAEPFSFEPGSLLDRFVRARAAAQRAAAGDLRLKPARKTSTPLNPMTPFEQLQLDSPYRALFRDRNPDPGACVVVEMDWERSVATITNGAVRFSNVDAADLFVWRKPDPTDPMEKLRAFLDPEDSKLATPMDLINALYPRVARAHNIAKVEAGSSWDYCKVATVDWLTKTPRWIPIHHDAYWYQMGCVPPYFQRNGVTMTGEAYSGAWHLSLLQRGDTYWCCMLKKSQVVEPSFIATIPFADIPMLGLPEEKEAEP